MHRTLELALVRTAGEEVPSGLASVAYEPGRLRAMREVELTAVLHSFRFDLLILWEAILDEARELGLAHDATFVRSLSRILEAVEQNVADVGQDHRHAREQQHRGPEDVRAAAFDRLIAEGGADENGILDLAQVLGQDVSAPERRKVFEIFKI